MSRNILVSQCKNFTTYFLAIMAIKLGLEKSQQETSCSTEHNLQCVLPLLQINRFRTILKVFNTIFFYGSANHILKTTLSRTVSSVQTVFFCNTQNQQQSVFISYKSRCASTYRRRGKNVITGHRTWSVRLFIR
jgi:hypothetical protein